MAPADQLVGLVDGQGEGLQPVTPVEEGLLPGLLGPKAGAAQLPTPSELDVDGADDDRQDVGSSASTPAAQPEHTGLEPGAAAPLLELNGHGNGSPMDQEAVGAAAGGRRRSRIIELTEAIDTRQASDRTGCHEVHEAMEQVGGRPGD